MKPAQQGHLTAMERHADARFLKNIGARILAEANDLKRTPEALAAELSISIETIRAVIAGEASVKAAEDVVSAMARAYPIPLADLWLERDDTQNGVRIMRSGESRATSRIFERPDRSGALAPYYEYRDTAMSRLAPFKPEWIQPLRVVDDALPDNPDVAYNHGHLLHQQTFFIGKVNFYWRAGGRAHCAEMNTGDSNYVTPFVPHSFTSRDEADLGLIIAVTYGGQVRRALSDFARIGAANADLLAGQAESPLGSFRATLQRLLAADSMSQVELSRRLQSRGVDARRASLLARGEALPTQAEVTAIADALVVRPKDIFVGDTDEAVAVRYASEAPTRDFPEHNRPVLRFRELARHRQQPGLRGFDVTVMGTLDDGPPDEGLRHGLHEYIYNYGARAAILEWEGGRDLLEPGDSAYVHPMVLHRFARQPSDEMAQLAVVRVPGALSEAALEEYASFEAAGRARVAGEDRRWY